MPSVSALFTCHVGIMNVHDFLLLINSIFELLYEQVHLGIQHVYLLELMHTTTSLVGLKMFLISTLVGGHLLHESCCT